MVDTDGIRAKGLHEVDIQCALFAVSEGIIVGELVSDSLDVELFAFASEEFGALDLNGRNRMSKVREQASGKHQ
jgi:hypothetical protein